MDAVGAHQGRTCRVRRVNVNDSALKHGISPEDATQAASWPIWIEDLDDDSPARQLRLGFDTRGRLLETVVWSSTVATNW